MNEIYPGRERVATFAAVACVAAAAACGGKQPAETAAPPELPEPILYQEEEPEREAEESELEGLMVEPRAEAEQPSPPALRNQRLEHFRLDDADLRQALRAISRAIGVNFVVSPEVQGSVSIDLTNVRADQALDYLLTPLGYDYEFRDDAVWIRRTPYETRIFAINYAVTGRQGTKSLFVGAGTAGGGGGRGGGGQLGGGGGGGQLGGGGGQLGGGGGQLGGGGGQGAGQGGAGAGMGAGISTINSASGSNIYQDLTGGLEAIVFDTAQVEEIQRGQTGGQQGGGQAGGGLLGGGTMQESQAIALTDPTGRKLIINPFAGLIQITALPDEIEKAADFLEQVEGSLQRQVLIEAQIVEVVFEDETQFGVDWSAILGEDGGQAEISQSVLGPEQNSNFQVNVTGLDVEAVLQALAQENDIRTLASPRVSTLNNQKTVLQATTQQVFFSSFVSSPVITGETVVQGERQFVPQVVPVGVVIDVTPTISEDGTITMDIRPSVTEIKGTARSPAGDTQPILDVRTIDTMARVQSGQTIVVGGLIDQRMERNKNKVPVLGDIPVVGGLFSNRRDSDKRSQLVMFITPQLQTGMRIQELSEAERLQLQRMMEQRR